MRRRDFIIFLVGAMGGWPSAVRAQQKAIPVIGFLSGALPGPYKSYVAAFHQGMSETGYVEGQNVAIEYRWAEGHHDRLPALATELVDRRVDVIATSGGPVPARAAKNATATIPIVFVAGDPIGEDLGSSLAPPGATPTGISIMSTELMPKRIELLSELVPQARLIALLVNPNTGAERMEGMIRDVQEAARVKGLQLHILRAGNESEIDTGFATLVQ